MAKMQKSLKRSYDMAIAQQVSSYALMNPALWQNLPRELLVLVLARLPLPKITSLYCRLSKEWTMDMEFIRACDEANPNMVALLSYSNLPNEFSVRIFDFNKNVWLHAYCFTLENAPSGNLTAWKPMASDGGLVCFVSIHKYTKANPLRIVVINPLTRVQQELPPLQNVYTGPPTLVHMKVDSKTKAYKVVVVGSRRWSLGTETYDFVLRQWSSVGSTRWSLGTEIYDSISRQWSSVVPSWGRIWDRECEYKIGDCNYIHDAWEDKIILSNCFYVLSSRLLAYDLNQGQLELLDDNSLFQCKGARVIQYKFAGDRVFVLHEEFIQPGVAGSKFYFITEFQCRNNATAWTPVKTHRPSFLQEPFLFDIHACEDVLVISGERLYTTNKIFGFLNISTGEWHHFPSEIQGISLVSQPISLVCRVFWNVTP